MKKKMFRGEENDVFHEAIFEMLVLSARAAQESFRSVAHNQISRTK